jgi:general secretion pathway protein M
MNELSAKIKAWYGALAERDRRTVLIGSVVLALLLLVGGVLMPLEAAVSNAVQRADTRRKDLAWMRLNAPEIQSAGMGLMRQANSNEPPMITVDRVGHEQGLGSAFKGTSPSANGVRVQLEGAAFDAVVLWITTLDQRYGLAIDSITIDRAARPGVVNANVTFAASHR